MTVEMSRRARAIARTYYPPEEFDVVIEGLPIYKPRGVGSPEYFMKTRLPEEEHAAFLALLPLAAGPIAGMYYDLERMPQPFYPWDATKEEILKAAEADPDILAPNTIVERLGGKLIPIPIHRHPSFIGRIREAGELLDHAADLSAHPLQERYFRTLRHYLEAGDQEGLMRTTVEMPLETPIRLYVGFYESTLDKLFGRKRAPHLVVGVQNKRLTREYGVAFDLVREALPHNPADVGDVRFEVLEVFAVTGGMARWLFNWEVLPNEVRDTRAYGARITAFHNMHAEYLEDVIFPSAERHVHLRALPFPLSGQTKRFYIAARTLIGIGEEFGHLTFRTADARIRLRGMYDGINEVVARSIILAWMGERFLVDDIEEGDFHAALIMQIASTWGDIDKGAFADPAVFKNQFRDIDAHPLRDLIIFSRLVQNGALQFSLDGCLDEVDLARSAHSLIQTRDQYLDTYRSATEEQAEALLLRDVQNIQKTKLVSQVHDPSQETCIEDTDPENVVQPISIAESAAG